MPNSTKSLQHPRLNEAVISKFLHLHGTSTVKAAKDYLAKALGVSRSQKNEWARKILAASGLPAGRAAGGDLPPGAPATETYDVEVHECKAKTLEEVVELCGVDTDKWEPRGFSVRGGKTGFGWNARFSKKVEPAKQEIIEDLKNDLKQYSPKVAAIKRSVNPASDCVLEICIFDAHLGKHSWRIESGDDYDLKISKRVYMEALNDLVSKAKATGVKFGKVLFPIGNDYLTCDNSNLTTTMLTPQSVDGRFPKVYKEGRELLVEAINILKQIAPVDVVVCVGNHEVNSMFHLGDALECWFHADENVSIDNRPTPRKYCRYGQNLICYTHGDKIDHKKLPMLAAIESKDWSECCFREWHVGHLHHSRVTEVNGIRTRIIPSITGSDEYHNSHGYVGAIRTSEAFIFHPENGLHSILYSTPIK